METSSKNINWGPIRAVFGAILLFLGSQVAVGIIAVAVLTLMGWDANRIDTWFQSGNTPQFILSASVAVLTLGSLFWYLSLIRAHPKDIGLIRPRLNDLTYILLGAGIYIIAYIVFVSFIANIIPALNTEQTQDLGFDTTTAGNGLVLIFISLVVLPPIVEEVVVRGFLFTGLRSKLNFWFAAVISSGLFGLAHLLGGEGGSTIWIATIDTFTLGMVLAYLREKTGGLWAPIGLHALKNFVAFMALFVLKLG